MNNRKYRRFNIAIFLERDPVCEQVLKRIEIKDSSVYKESRYYFCGSICKKMFDRNPQAFADKDEKDMPKINLKQLKLFN